MNAHAYCGIIPSFQYILERINEGGDRFDAMDIFQGLRILDPSHAKDLPCDEVMSLIAKLKKYPRFVMGGNDSIVERLKKNWDAYKMEASEVAANFGKDFKKETE